MPDDIDDDATSRHSGLDPESLPEPTDEDDLNIEVANESGMHIPGFAESELVTLARFVLDALHVNPQSELSILLVDTTVMSDLHQKWLDEPGPTDVLSFPMDELRPGHPGAQTGPGHLGDIVLCPEVAMAQAKSAGHSTAEELLLLTTHSILHLLGFDHADPEEEAEMFGLQRQLLLTYLANRPSTGQAPAEKKPRRLKR